MSRRARPAASASAAECKQEAGAFRPIVDRNRYEGKADCVEVCPYEVFTVTTLPVEL